MNRNILLIIFGMLILLGVISIIANANINQTITTPSPMPTLKLTTITVFFNNTEKEDGECEDVLAVQRQIEQTDAIARSALNELLEGPTTNERQQGYITSIPNGVRIQQLEIQNGVARVDFNEELDKNIGGSCRVAAISAQIRKTLQQFPTVEEVVISVNGRTEDVLQP